MRVQTYIDTVGPTSVTVRAGTWADTQITGFSVTVIHYEKATNFDAVQIGSNIAPVPIPTGSKAFWALRHFDFWYGHNYRLQGAVALTSDGNATPTWTNSGDTAMYACYGEVLYMPKRVKKSKK